MDAQELRNLQEVYMEVVMNEAIDDEWCEQEILNAYKEAAKSDDLLFGNYDGYDAYKQEGQ